MEPYALVRGKRKTLALVVSRDGALTVRAPLRTPRWEIDRFVAAQQGWIERQRARLAANPPAYAPLTLSDGETLPLLGRPLTLRRAAVRGVTLRGDELLLPAAMTTTAPLKRWAKAQAEKELTPRLDAQCARLGLRPGLFKLSTAKSRWGSMSADGVLRLSIPLVFCPTDVVDYVLVHELCHIPHPNHSPAFWLAVAQALPGYREQRDWLKRNASLIRILG